MRGRHYFATARCIFRNYNTLAGIHMIDSYYIEDRLKMSKISEAVLVSFKALLELILK